MPARRALPALFLPALLLGTAARGARPGPSLAFLPNLRDGAAEVAASLGKALSGPAVPDGRGARGPRRRCCWRAMHPSSARRSGRR